MDVSRAAEAQYLQGKTLVPIFFTYIHLYKSPCTILSPLSSSTSLSISYRTPVTFLSPSRCKKTPCRSPVALLSLSCCSPVPLSCRLPVASLWPLALLPSCRLPFAFLSLILSLCLVSCCFPVATLSPPCRPPVALLLPSCRSSPVAFLSPACRFLSLSCHFPAAFLSSSCRHPVIFQSPPCRLPVAPCRISPSPASRGPNLLESAVAVLGRAVQYDLARKNIIIRKCRLAVIA